MPPRRVSGSIKTVRRDHGYAFLFDEHGEEWFAHASDFEGYPDIDRAEPGQRCTFEDKPYGRGAPRAGRVRIEE